MKYPLKHWVAVLTVSISYTLHVFF